MRTINLTLYLADYLINSYVYYFDNYYKTWSEYNGTTSQGKQVNIISPTANSTQPPIPKAEKEKVVLDLWDSGVKNQAEIVRKINYNASSG